jgi:oligosaccharide repeat unit polymerase
MTWICLALAVIVFWLVFELLTRELDGWTAADMQSVYRWFSSAESPLQLKRLLTSMAVLTAVSWLSFLVEAWRLGFIPLFSYGVPHAYSYFHVTGLHYFTVSGVLVPSLFVIYSLMVVRRGKGLTREKGFVIGLFLCIFSLMIPVLCVSRFQLILAVGMAVFTYISMTGTFPLPLAAGSLLFLVPSYVVLTYFRSHSVEYLNGIFEMKNSAMPIFITQPYMYIANNYDNFNCLVTQLPEHTHGLRMLFPLWAFSGAKFFAPSLVNFPLYVTKEELTTLTLFYDAYYDFGIVGMALFGGILGAACYYLGRRRRKSTCPAGHMIYAQIAMYMMLSFFTTWFSNPATWFYLAVSTAVYLYVRS